MTAGPSRAQVAAGLASPRSVAIVGDTPGSGRGGLIHERLVAMGFAGRIFPVNPKYAEVRGMRAFPSLTAIDGPVDFVAIAVAAPRAVEAAREAVAVGARGLLVISSGFADAGPEGAALQQELAHIGREAAVPIIGPNCYGYVDVRDHFAPYFGALVEPLRPGPLALVFQSGALTHAATDAPALRSPGYSHIITIGNEAVLDSADYLEHVLDDPEVRVVACYLEAIRRPERFLSAARRAAERDVAVLLLKAGRSALGRRAALAHTGAVAGRDEVWDAALSDVGAVRVNDVDELIETAVLAARHRSVGKGPVRLASISGGGSAILSDVAEMVGLPMSPLDAATAGRLTEVLPPFATAANPLDLTGAVVEDPALVARALSTLATQDAALVAFVLNSPFATDPAERDLYRALAVAALDADTNGVPMALVSLASGGADPVIAKMASARSVPFLCGPRQAALAIARLRQRRLGPPRGDWSAPRAAIERLAASPPGLLEPSSGRDVLTGAGVRVPKTGLARTPQEAALCAERLGWPVVLKIASPDVAHKSEVGGVRTGISDGAAARVAAESMLAALRDANPLARVLGIEVHEQIPAGIELLVGVLVEPGLPPVMVLSFGGILAELGASPVSAIAPTDRATARELLEASAAWPLFAGYRGTLATDPEPCAEALASIGRLAHGAGELLGELEVNPLVVVPNGTAYALDVLMVRR